MLVTRTAILAALAAAGLAGLAYGQATTAPPAKVPAETAPAPPPSAKELQDQLLEKARAGKLTGQVIDQFFQYADARAREKLVPGAVPQEFWDWVTSNKVVHRGLLMDLYPDYKPATAKCLERLRQKFGKEVDAYAHLSLAFAMVFSRAGDMPLRSGSSRRKDPAGLPTMEESFEFYVRNKNLMRYPLGGMTWPMLLYVADNDVSIDDRKWALTRYQTLTPVGFGKIYYDVPYDMEGRRGKKLRIEGVPYTLQNILQYSGVCADRAYYSSRILKTMGVPAMYDGGQGARGGHAWLTWIEPKGNQFKLTTSGRWDFDKYYVGEVYYPLTRRAILDREVELVAVAVGRNYNGYVNSLVACKIYEMCQGDDRRTALGLLKDAIAAQNPYCAEAWRRLAKAVAEGLLTAKQGESLYIGMLKSFAEYPDLTFDVLEEILKPRLAATTKPPEEEVKGNIVLLDKAFALYDSAQRPDLAVKLRVLQGRYLEATGYADKALTLYTSASRQYATTHFGFVELFDRALALMKGPQEQDMKLKYCELMVKTVPEYQDADSRNCGEINPSYVHVVRAYAAALKEAGKTAEAAQWENKVKGAKE